jgi:hypothetical protein
VFVLGVLFSILLVIYSIYKIYNPVDYEIIKHSNDQLLRYYLKLILIGGIGLIFFGFGLRLKTDLKMSLSVMLAIGGITVYGYETYYVFSGKVKLYNYNKKQVGIL